VNTSAVLVTTAGLFLGMLVCLETGYRLGHQAGRRHERFHEGLGGIEAAIFALLGLLLGFAFAGAMSRLDARRQLIVHEANAIGTAYLRVAIRTLVAGYAIAQRPDRSALHMILYAAAVSITVYAMLDLDNPRVGLIRLDATERILMELHDSIR
jgi:hypothetical protein